MNANEPKNQDVTAIFDAALNRPLEEVEDKYKRCYRHTKNASGGKTVSVKGDTFELVACTKEEWPMLIAACNEWVYQLVHIEGKEYFPFNGPPEWLSHNRECVLRDLYPNQCLVKDEKVIGFAIENKWNTRVLTFLAPSQTENYSSHFSSPSYVDDIDIEEHSLIKRTN